MNTAEIANGLLTLLRSDAGSRIKNILVTYEKNDNDPFWAIIKNEPETSKVIKFSGHNDHFHLNLLPAATNGLLKSKTEFYVAPVRDTVSKTQQRAITQVNKVSVDTVSNAKNSNEPVNSFYCYPNPVSANTSVKIVGQITGAREVKIIVYDFSGRKVYEADRNIVDKFLSAEIPGSSISGKGIYLVKISGMGFNETKKILVQ
jgi:hypothetical protein